MQVRGLGVVFALAVAAILTVAAPTLAAYSELLADSEEGNIDCARVAAVESRTMGDTYVAPPGEPSTSRVPTLIGRF